MLALVSNEKEREKDMARVGGGAGEGKERKLGGTKVEGRVSESGASGKKSGGGGGL